MMVVERGTRSQAELGYGAWHATRAGGLPLVMYNVRYVNAVRGTQLANSFRRTVLDMIWLSNVVTSPTYSSANQLMLLTPTHNPLNHHKVDQLQCYLT